MSESGGCDDDALSGNVALLMDLFGFTNLNEVKQALIYCNNDVNAAAEHLYAKKDSNYYFGSSDSNEMAIVLYDDKMKDASTSADPIEEVVYGCAPDPQKEIIMLSPSSSQIITEPNKSQFVSTDFARLVSDAKSNMFGDRALQYLKNDEPLALCLQAAISLCQQESWMDMENTVEGRQFITNVLPSYFSKFYLQFASVGVKAREGVHAITLLFFDFFLARITFSPQHILSRELFRILATIFSPDVSYHSLHKNSLPYSCDAFVTYENMYARSGIGKAPYFFLVNAINGFGKRDGFLRIRELGDRILVKHSTVHEEDINETKELHALQLDIAELTSILMPFALCSEFLTDTSFMELTALTCYAVNVLNSVCANQLKGRDNPIVNLIISVRVLLNNKALRKAVQTALSDVTYMPSIITSKYNLNRNACPATSSSDSSPPLKRQNTSRSPASSQLGCSIQNLTDEIKLKSFLDMVYLDILTLLLSANRFDSRMLALREICNLIQDSRCMKSTTSDFFESPSVSGKPSALGQMSASCRRRQALQENVILDWIKMKKIINVAMNSMDNSTYSDLLTEMVLLLGEQSFSLDVYELWESRRNKSERVLQNMNKMMVPLLSQRMNPAQLLNFWNVVRKEWHNERNNYKARCCTLDFLRIVGLAFHESSRAKDVIFLLWDLSVEEERNCSYPSPVSNDISLPKKACITELGTQSILEIIKQSSLANQDILKTLIEKAVAAIKTSHHSYHCLIFLKNLFNVGMDKTNFKLAKRQLRDFCQASNIIREVLHSLVRNNVSNRKNDNSSDSNEESYTHEQLIKAHLDLLHYIFTKSSQELSKEEILLVWSKFITPTAVSQSTKDILFDWVTSFIDNFDSSLPELLLNECSKLNPITICTTAAFKCYRTLFELVNVQKGKIRILKNQKFYIEKYDLTGYSFLWDIALFSGNLLVSQQASAYILDLMWLQSEGCTRKDPAKTHKHFLNECKSRIQKALNTYGNGVTRALASVCVLAARLPIFLGASDTRSPSKARSFSVNYQYDCLPRCLRLCRDYIDSVENESKLSRPLPPHIATFRGDELTFSVAIQCSPILMNDANSTGQNCALFETSTKLSLCSEDGGDNDEKDLLEMMEMDDLEDIGLFEKSEKLVWSNKKGKEEKYSTNIGYYDVCMDCNETFGRLRHRLKRCLVRRFNLGKQSDALSNSSDGGASLFGSIGSTNVIRSGSLTVQIFSDGKEIPNADDWRMLKTLSISDEKKLSALVIKKSPPVASSNTLSGSFRSGFFSKSNYTSDSQNENDPPVANNFSPNSESLKREFASFVLASDASVYEMLFYLADGIPADLSVFPDHETNGNITTEIRILAWDLLERLPTWCEMIPKAKDFAKAHYDAKMLYQLQILNGLLEPLSENFSLPIWRPRRRTAVSLSRKPSSSSVAGGDATASRRSASPSTQRRRRKISNAGLPHSWAPWVHSNSAVNTATNSGISRPKQGSAGLLGVERALSHSPSSSASVASMRSRTSLSKMNKSRSQPTSPSLRRRSSSQSVQTSSNLSTNAASLPKQNPVQSSGSSAALLTLLNQQDTSNVSQFGSSSSLASHLSHLMQPMDEVAACELVANEMEWFESLLNVMKHLAQKTKSTMVLGGMEPTTETASTPVVNHTMRSNSSSSCGSSSAGNNTFPRVFTSSTLVAGTPLQSRSSSVEYSSKPISHFSTFAVDCCRFVIQNLCVLLIEEDNSRPQSALPFKCTPLVESLSQENAKELMQSLLTICWFHSFPWPESLPLRGNIFQASSTGFSLRSSSILGKKKPPSHREESCERVVLIGMKLLFTCIVTAASTFMFHFMNIDSLEAYLMHMLVYSPLERVRRTLSEYMVALVCEPRLLPGSMSSVKNELLHYVTTWNLPFWVSSTSLSRSSKLISHCEAFFHVYGSYLGNIKAEQLMTLHIDLKQLIQAEYEWINTFYPSTDSEQRINVDDTLIACHLNALKNLCRQSVNMVSTPPDSALAEYLIKSSIVGGQLLRPLLSEYLFPAAYTAKSNFLRFLSGSRQLEFLPKCGGSKSKKAAFQLIQQLCLNCPENVDMVGEILIFIHHDRPLPLSTPMEKSSVATCSSSLTAIHNSIISFTEWDYSPDTNSRAVGEFMGLVNGGATCYMNAVLQQIFMIPGLCERILALNSRVCDPDKSLLYRLQELLAHLLESRMQVYHPERFWSVFRFSEDRPFNKSEQQDAFEFFQTLIVNVIEEVEKMELPNIFDSRFCGIFADVKYCEPCGHRFSLEEPFLGINLPVLNMSCLEESLHEYFSGIWLEGDEAYTCETCAEERRTLKQSTLKNLPSVVCLQLKRFDYDWNRGTPLKYNNRFSFPKMLDLTPYTTETVEKEILKNAKKFAKVPEMEILEPHLDHFGDSNDGENRTNARPKLTNQNSSVRFMLSDTDDSDTEEESVVNSPNMDQNRKQLRARHPSFEQRNRNLYHLVGVIVHQGSANAGHYYSYIKCRGRRVRLDPTRESWNISSQNWKSGDACTLDQQHSINQWYKFNDSTIEKIDDFSEEFMEEHCYGGPLKGDAKTLRNYNAYLLFYERDDDGSVSDDRWGSQFSLRSHGEINQRSLRLSATGGSFSFVKRLEDTMHKDHSSNGIQVAKLIHSSLPKPLDHHHLTAASFESSFNPTFVQSAHASPLKPLREDLLANMAAVKPKLNPLEEVGEPNPVSNMHETIVHDESPPEGVTVVHSYSSNPVSRPFFHVRNIRRINTSGSAPDGDRKRRTVSGSYAEMQDLMRQGDPKTLYTQDHMPVSIARHIREKNLLLVRDRDLFNSQYVGFVRLIIEDAHKTACCQSDTGMARPCMRLMTHFIFNTLWHMPEPLRKEWPLEDIVLNFQSIIKVSSGAAEELIRYLNGSGAYHLELFLLRCPDHLLQYQKAFISILESIFQHHKNRVAFNRPLHTLFEAIASLLRIPEFLDVSSLRLLGVVKCLKVLLNKSNACLKWLLELGTLQYILLYLCGSTATPLVIDNNLQKESFQQRVSAFDLMCLLMKAVLSQAASIHEDQPLFNWLGLQIFRLPCPSDLWPLAAEVNDSINSIGCVSSHPDSCKSASTSASSVCCTLNKNDPVHQQLADNDRLDLLLRVILFGLQEKLSCKLTIALDQDPVAQTICMWMDNHWIVSFKCIWYLLVQWQNFSPTDEKNVAVLFAMSKLFISSPTDDYYIARMHLFLHGFTISETNKEPQPIPGFLDTLKSHQFNDHLHAYLCVKFLLTCCEDNTDMCELVQEVANDDLRPIIDWLRNALHDEHLESGLHSPASMEVDHGDWVGGGGDPCCSSTSSLAKSQKSGLGFLSPPKSASERSNSLSSALNRYPSASGNLAKAQFLWSSAMDSKTQRQILADCLSQARKVRTERYSDNCLMDYELNDEKVPL